MSERMKPVIFKIEPELIVRSDRVTNAFPEYERSRSRFFRQAIRDALERREAELKEREEAA